MISWIIWFSFLAIALKFVKICQDETRDANRYNRIPFFSRLLLLSVSQDSDRTGHTD
ncbi:hypothetical protein IQ229_10970 [Nostoc cf. edaphicum LEGE 07299]|uniref:Transposase n=1 Tax=Nostoc cf. edaphicum LEGE 07299 TaxID=2777974 RepID=A0ABR9TYD0_9NOSO|nr:hypothetical protein [Nostoc edaphicum]MBE9105443.1 hypothetical protein [Nostoc cf. edaphicum LEGE 07299]